MARNYDLTINTRDDKFDKIDLAIKKMDYMKEALLELKKGRAESVVCREYDINKGFLRRLIFYPEHYFRQNRDTTKKYDETEAASALCTGGERLYAVVTGRYISGTSIPSDADKTISYCMKNSNLTYTETKILRMRYWECMTLEEIGSILGLTRERIRQIEARAINKLNKYNKDMFTYGYNAIEESRVARLERENAQKLKLLERHKKALDESKIINEEIVELNEDDKEIYTVKELKQKMSVRLYNVLKHSGYKNATLSEIAALGENKILHLRNCGVKSIRELECLLNEYGYKLED